MTGHARDGTTAECRSAETAYKLNVGLHQYLSPQKYRRLRLRLHISDADVETTVIMF